MPQRRAAHEACPEACADHQPAATTTTTSADDAAAVVGETSTTVAFEVAPAPVYYTHLTLPTKA